MTSLSRRDVVMAGLAAMMPAIPEASAAALVATGADLIARDGFRYLAGRRVGLVTNQTGRSVGQHIVDLWMAAGVKLAAILAPEHGFRGDVEAGKSFRGSRDARTGIPIHSIYGATQKPTAAMLAGLDVLVFDIQDIGARFYTYISTLGLAMQAAAEASLPFLVLDRPNPLGGIYVDGFVLEPAHRSFVGQYPLPIVHGLTVGELARMIQGERWLSGLEKLSLKVIGMEGWRRAMRWPATGLPWVATSPNIPTFASALVYPGIGIVGELTVNEGRGTPTPFELFGAPWLDGRRIADSMNAARLAGVRFEPQTYTPRAIANVAANPRFDGKRLNGVRVVVTNIDAVRPLEIGIHAMVHIISAAKEAGIAPVYGNDRMFTAIAGTRRLRRMLDTGASAIAIMSEWTSERDSFIARRKPYEMYV